MPGLEGTSLGRYRLKRRLGRGGMAEVYLATDERMHRDVAIKVVSSSHQEFAERFSREAEAMGNLHHDHILIAYDYGEQEPWHYLVMPYMPQGTLADLLKDGPLSLEHAGELLQQIASGLQYAHQHGFIHRDIKPSNILLRDDHYAYLADFGLARVLEGSSDLTQTGTLLGTPEYMAPELAEGPASQSSDIYALAIVLYQMVSGRVPFRGETAISIFWKHVRDFPQPASQFNPTLTSAVDRVLLRALEKDPARRYATPLALSQAYQEAIAGLEEMPSLYATDVIAQPVQNLRPVAPPPEPQRVVLPPVQTPPAARRPHPPLSPAPAQQYDQPTDMFTPGPTTVSARPYQPEPRRRGGRLLGSVLIGLAFLLVVSSLLIFLGVQRNQHSAASATASAYAAATNTVEANQTSQVQQAQATLQAATAVAVTATAHAQATATGIVATETAIIGSTPLLTDSLSNQDDNGWVDDGSVCTFENSSYNILLSKSNTLQPCVSNKLQYADAAFQVDVTLVSAANGGLIFRANAASTAFYDFEITNDGKFYFRYRNNNAYTSLISDTTNSAVLVQGNSNTLLVIARGSDFQLFINNTLVGNVHDTTFATGYLGFGAGTLSSSQGQALFTGLNIYKVS
jgi:serine/threonine protein kinase